MMIEYLIECFSIFSALRWKIGVIWEIKEFQKIENLEKSSDMQEFVVSI